MLGHEQHLARAQPVGERPVASHARLAFDTRTCRDLHRNDLQPYAQALADPFAMRGPAIRDGLQTMMDVDGTERRQPVQAPQANQCIEQDGRIQPAGKGDTPCRRIEPGFQNGEEMGFECHARTLGKARRQG